MEILDPGDEKKQVLILTKERVRNRLRNGMLVVRGKDKERQITKEEKDSLIEVVLTLSFTYNSVA